MGDSFLDKFNEKTFIPIRSDVIGNIRVILIDVFVLFVMNQFVFL